MNASDSRLDLETHARIFASEVEPRSGISEVLSHDKPKAVILGGQPGAGKGGLARVARNELHGDVVKIDPDELREYHPRIHEFRNGTPYNWSGLTQPDASAWADELLDATVAGKKNLIFDTTLSNGQWTTEDLIPKLQAQGYEVEVRAIATSKLESELGVDERFSKRLDEFGYGRYVPAGARDAIYENLPGSLDMIHERTDVPIRLFNREGVELYDSRTDTRLPGSVLEEAREARLLDPKLTRDLNHAWQRQVRWHDDLPEALARNEKVAPDTARRLLAERADEHVVEGVARDAELARHIDYTARIQPRVHAGSALGIVGTAATAYDIADTAHDVSRLRAQGNDTAAAARIERFAVQNVGGWGGAAAGVAGGALAGVETGPGLLVTGAIGGVIGAVAGDKVGDWLDERKINRQEDPQGRTWTFDPEQPERGWTHQVRTIDAEAMRFQTSDAIRYRTETLTAAPALSERLNFQASSTSIELALGAPPRSRDPYSLPAGEQDARSAREAPWTRDPDTWQWSREVSRIVDYRHNSEAYEKQVVQASPQRTMELEQQSREVIARNAGQTPAAMATRFMEAYEGRGWAQYGPLPETVTDALQHPGRIVGSDGDLYQRDAQGQWTHNGLLWDSDAKGNLRDELDATYRSQQADEPIPTLEPVRVTAPPTARGESMPAPGLQLPDSLKDPAHPGHDAYRLAADAVYRMEFANKIPAGPHSERLSAAVAVKSEQERFWPGSVQLRQDADGQIDIIQRSYGAPDKHWTLDTRQALSRSVEEHSHDWSAARSTHYVSQAPAAERTPEHVHALEQLSSSDRALFDRIRDQVPAHIGDDRVLQAMVEGREQARIDRPERLGAVEIRGDRLSLIDSSAAGLRASFDLSERSPSIHESLERNSNLNQQLAQQQTLEAHQRAQSEQQGQAIRMG